MPQNNLILDKLCLLVKSKQVDWDEFDALLQSLEDINYLNDEYEETYLSDFIRKTDYNSIEENIPVAVQHFLDNGFDASANNGKNVRNESANNKYEFSESVVFWFDEKPLILNNYLILVANPNVTEENHARLNKSNEVFKSVIGSILKDVTYINDTICLFDFDNGIRIVFKSKLTNEDNYIGTFEYRKYGKYWSINN